METFVRSKQPHSSSMMMAKENVSTSPEQVEEDLSLLQQPLQTAFTGFQEARRAFEDGTDEVRHLLLHECSLIYECNVCRNLFRSLANFISHKRAFCSRSVGTTSFSKRFSDGNSAVIVQSSDIDNTKGSVSSRSTPVPETRTTKATTNTRDLCGVIERLKREKGSKNLENKETVLHLEKVPTSTNAVYQTIKHVKGVDSIQTEVNEVYNLLNNKYTEVGPDGKALTKNKYPLTRNKSEERNKDFVEQNHESFGELFCETCNLGFQTEKTLEMHRQKKHISTTFVYLCPECSLTFLKPAKVMQHLIIDHMKSRRRVRNMREGIIRRRIKQCDAPPVKIHNRELKRLQLDSDVKEKAENADNANAEVLPKCAYCGETFKRNAALTSHKVNCPQKKEEQNKQSTKASIPINQKEKEPRNHLNNNSKLETKVVENDAAEVLTELFANMEMPKLPISLQTVTLERLHMSDLSNSDNSNASIASNASVFNGSTKSDDNDQSLGGLNENSNPFLNMNDNLPIFNPDDSLPPSNVDTILPLSNASNNLTQNSHPFTKDEIDASIQMPINLLDNDNDCPNASLKPDETEVPILKIKRKRVSEKLTACLCKICHKKFNTISNVKRHISMFHYRARHFKCDLCDYQALRKYDVANHLGLAHNKSESRDVLIKDYVKSFEVTHSNKDMESTILVMPDDDEDINENFKPKISPLKIKLFQKRKKKNLKQLTLSSKVSSPVPSSPLTTEVSLTCSTPKENSSQFSHNDEGLQTKVTKKSMKKAESVEVAPFGRKKVSSLPNELKRPTRRRSKPVNKDFIYDSVKTCKKDTTSDKDSPKVTRKRLNTTTSCSLEEMKNKSHKVEKSGKKSVTFNILQKFPPERLQIPQRLTPNQNVKQAGPVIDSEDLEAARLNTPLLADVFFEEFTRNSNGSSSTFKIKPCLESSHKTLNSFLETIQSKSLAKSKELSKAKEEMIIESNKELNLSTNQVNNSQNEIDVNVSPPTTNGNILNVNDNFQVKLLTEEAVNEKNETEYSKNLETKNRTDFQSEHLKLLNDKKDNVEPRSEANGSAINEEESRSEVFPKRRLTLMQHLAETKRRRKDSLLRTALESHEQNHF